jgi:hypothetical protein
VEWDSPHVLERYPALALLALLDSEHHDGDVQFGYMEISYG